MTGGHAHPGRGNGGSSGISQRVERARLWLERFTGALESGDLSAFDGLFVLESTYRPGPYSPILRGRTQVRRYWEGLVEGMRGLSTSAEVLGVGSTYTVAHWRLDWAGPPAGSADGVLLIALDPLGRCTAVREWAVSEPD